MLIVAGPKIQVAKQNIHREVEEARIGVSDCPIAGNLYCFQSLKIIDEVLANILDTILRIVALGLLLRKDRLSNEGYFTIVEGKLQVGPRTISLDHSVLFAKDIFITVILHVNVYIGQEVVAVVDDRIVVAWSIVCIVVADIEHGNLQEVRRGDIGHICQVATQFAQQDGSVRKALQLIQHTYH